MLLNIDQKRIVEAEPNGHMLIKGVAGSGKTTVAVHRLPLLLDYYCPEEDDRVLLMTYNKSLVKYIDYVYQKIERQASLFNLEECLNQKLRINTIDKLIFQIYKKIYPEFELASTGEQRNVVNYVIHQLVERYSDISWFKPTNTQFFLSEIIWMKACGYVTIQQYQEVDRFGRASADNNKILQRIQKNSKQREAIFEVFNYYNNVLNKRKLTDFQGMALAVKEYIQKNEVPKYTHILVDESQDLSKIQLDIIGLLRKDKKYGSVVFISDSSQSIYEVSWLSYNSYSSIGYDMSGRSRVLSKNYRTTKQIAKAAYSMIEKEPEIIGNENYVQASVVEREGEYPFYQNFHNEKLEYDYIAKQITALSKRYELKDMVVMAKRNSTLVEIKEYLLTQGIDTILLKEALHEDDLFKKDALKCITMHAAKGLEFKVVFIAGLNEGLIPQKQLSEMDDNKRAEIQDRKLLYVGMTRAEELLFLSSSGSKSPFIDDIEKSFLNLEPLEIELKVPSIMVSDYLFKEKIMDIYRDEERIRQGILRILMEAFNFKLVELEIEYPIKFYSKQGYVDIACFDSDRKEDPVFFVEVKASHENLEEHVTQLQSYMMTVGSVKYGLLTNGHQFLYFEKMGSSIKERLMPPTFERKKQIEGDRFYFNSILHNKKMIYQTNREDENEILIHEDGENSFINVQSFIPVPLIGSVSAGVLKEVDDEVEGCYKIPIEWLSRGYHHHFLRVDGDSMVNAGIEPDDLVLVRQQPTVDNYDIAIVFSEEEVTMKKIIFMEEKVILMPENSKYQPVILEKECVRIHGKVIGVMKQMYQSI